MRARPAVAASAAVVALALVPAAHRRAIVDRAAQSLANDPVYVDPAAQPTLSADGQAELRVRDRRARRRADLRRRAARGRQGRGRRERDRRARQGRGRGRRPGVYAIVAGGQFRAGATGDSGLARGQAAKLATAAFEAHHDDGLAATLVDFVDRVGEARSERLGAVAEAADGGFPFLWVLLGAGLVGVATLLAADGAVRPRAGSPP